MNILEEKIRTLNKCPICKEQITDEQKSMKTISTMWNGKRSAHYDCLLPFFEKVKVKVAYSDFEDLLLYGGYAFIVFGLWRLIVEIIEFLQEVII